MCVGDEGVRSRIRSRSTTSYHPPPPPRPSLFPCYSTEFLFGRENENSWCKARSSERAAGVRVGSSEAQQIGAPPPRCTRVLRFRGPSSLRHSGRGPHAMTAHLRQHVWGSCAGWFSAPFGDPCPILRTAHKHVPLHVIHITCLTRVATTRRGESPLNRVGKKKAYNYAQL